MVSLSDYENSVPIAWCPGCGNFAILNTLKQSLVGKEGIHTMVPGMMRSSTS